MATKTLFGGRRTALAIPAVLALLAGSAMAAPAPKAAPPASESERAARAIEFADNLSAAFRGAASTISPSVVNIAMVDKPDVDSDRARAGGTAPRAPEQIPEEFRHFFRFGPDGAPEQAPERRGQGTGVIIRQDGYILTNNHVVDGADELMVRLHDGRELAATIVGADPDSDLAVIRVDESGLPAARFGDSDRVRTGDWIVAVGNPFGLDHTVTAGVISATGRGEMGLNTYEDFLQTDAAINPGNSGGPMVNLHGEVVGINSAIRSAAGANNGVGFAIPANLAMHVAGSLMDDGRVDRGWLGVSIQALTPDLASSLGSSRDVRGALVADVMPGTPAATAGLQSGDIIVRIDERMVDSARVLKNTIAQREPGERVTIGVDRGGTSRMVDVTLGERPGSPELASRAATPAHEGALGLRVQPLTPELATQLGVDGSSGLVVTEVRPESPASRAGLRAEDVILEAGRRAVSSPADLAGAAKDASDGLLLKVRRDGRTSFVVLKPGS